MALLLAAISLVAAGVLIMAPVQAQATEADSRQSTLRTKTIQVNTHYTEPPSEFDGVQCRGLASSPDCGLRFVGTATFTGTMHGEVYYDLTGSITPEGKVTYEGPDYIDGGVTGCGTGTYIIDDSEGYVDMTKYDPITNSAPGFNRWTLRPGSGTGELKNLVSGKGVNHWRMYFSGFLGMGHYGKGHFTGSITCRL